MKAPDDEKLLLFEKQKSVLDTFLSTGALTRAQYEKSLGDLRLKMGIVPRCVKILLTAFDPFGGEPVNPALEAVKLVHAPENVTLVRLEVPTVFGKAGDTVVSAIKRERPDAVLCVGQAAGRAALTPELVGVNLCSASIPDNDGNMPDGVPVIPGAPDKLFSTLLPGPLVSAIRAVGVPAEVSDSAGRFVCNSLLFTVLNYVGTEPGGIPAGFIHVPCVPEQLPRMKPGTPALPLDVIVRGLDAAVSNIAGKLL